jgi:hypothetical protein
MRPSTGALRRAVVLAAMLIVALGLLWLSIICLRGAGSIAVGAGYGRVAHFEAFGGPPDPEEERRAWRAVRRFQITSGVLFVLSLGTGSLAVWSFRRARRAAPPDDSPKLSKP